MKFRIVVLALLITFSLSEEAYVSEIYPVFASLDEVVKESLVIMIGKEGDKKEFTFDSQINVPDSKESKSEYSVIATAYILKEIIWINGDNIKTCSLGVQEQINALEIEDMIYVFDHNDITDAQENFRNKSGLGTKSYEKYYYEPEISNKVSKDNLEIPEDGTVILFLRPMNKTDNTWVLISGAIESLSARKIIENIIKNQGEVEEGQEGQEGQGQ